MKIKIPVAIIILGLLTGCVTTDLYTPPPQSTSKSSGLPSDLPPIFKLGLQDSEKELQNIDDFFGVTVCNCDTDNCNKDDQCSC